ncbi:MAG: KOW domain-containing RNA-binding protein [Clostridia bacterium]|nr:KOW domain-containing RNA-binding protein [Clostridia bacterium]
MNEVIGQVVISKAGRDAGRAFVIVAVADDAHVLLSDGDLRGLARPKRKKLRHIKPTGVYIGEFGNMLSSGGLNDAEVRRLLKQYGFAKTHAQGEMDVETRCN